MRAVHLHSGGRHVPSFLSLGATGDTCRASERCRRSDVRTAYQNCNRDRAAVISAKSAASAARLRQLIEAGALTEAAFALIDLELPQWKLRRITYDGGEWHCAMSRERELPEWLDEAVEARHASLTLAILSVYIETVRQIEVSKKAESSIGSADTSADAIRAGLLR